MLELPLKPLLYIAFIGNWCSLFPVFFLSICYIVSVCRALGQTHSLTSFGLWGLAMCVAVKRWIFIILNIVI
jgi:hypothetical protein